jgi:protocatechuate 3,4-dioxygenase beta subunit
MAAPAPWRPVAERHDPSAASTTGEGSLAGRLIVVFAALVCFFFVTTLRDVLLLPPLPASIPAPPVPATVMDRDAGLDAIVVDEAGHPIAGASVRVFAMREGRAYYAGDRDTAADGRASFGGLPRGEAWVLAYGPGRSRASLRAVLAAGVREEKLVLRPARALDVVVVDEGEQPVALAGVEVTAADPLPYAAITGRDGAARVDRLGAPPYRVKVSARGYDDTVRSGVVPGAAPLRIRLERLATLEVTVMGTDGKPAAGATVLAAGTGLWPARSTVVDGAGTTTITGLHGGVYDLQARRGDEVSPTDFAVPVKRGEQKSVQLTLGAGKRVKITVTDGPGEGAPAVKGASVVLAEEGLSSFPLQGTTDEHGVADLGPIAKQRATAAARAAGFVPRSAVLVDAAATEARIALEKGGVLSGDVVDDRGFPVAGASIEVVGVDAEGMPIDESTTMTDFRDEHFAMTLGGPAPLVPMGELGVMPGPIPDLPHGGAGAEGSVEAKRGGDPWVTRSDGTFRADPVPPGRVHAIVRHPDYVEALSEVVTVRSGAEATVHVVLRQGGWIEGRILEEDRTPVAGARVELAATRGALERVAYAADDGTFTFAAAPDEVLLSVARPGAPSDIVARTVVDVPDRDRRRVEIVLPRARDTVAIHVADDRGYPIDRVEVRAVSLDLAEPLQRTLFTDAGGDVELPDARGLPLRITLVRPGKAPLVEAEESAPAKLVFTLTESVTAHGAVTGRGGRDRLAGADVTLFTATGARHGKTDEQGEYTFDDLAPGRVRVSVTAAEHASGEAVAHVRGDRDHPADLGAIDLAEAGEVEGQVVDADDQPVAGARVARDGVPTYLPLGPLPRGIVATDREGRFTLGGLPEGHVALEAYFADLGRAQVADVPVRAGRTTTRVKIAFGAAAPASREPKGAGSVAVTLGEHGRSVLVAMVPPASEAEAAGVEPGDEIVAVNGREVRSIEAARKRLTGPLDEDVLLSLKRDDGQDGAVSWLLRVRRERVRR